jgi:6-phosphogluconolactonase
MAAPLPRLAAADYFVYYGTGNGGADNGISLGHFDTVTGLLTKPVLAAQAEGPSFFVLSADHKHLYSCLEKAGKIGAYEIDAKTGALKLLNTLPSGGAGPCFISLDKTGHYALVANYDSGSMAVFSIKADGSLGEQTGADQHTGKGVDASRQEGPHAHCIITDPTNHFALCTDLGNDKIYIYKFDEKTGKISANDPAFVTVKAGLGPRHLLFNPNGKVLYCITEMGATVLSFNWDATNGTLTQFQSVPTLPADFKIFNKDAELMISPNGQFLYASTRGHDTIVVFAIDPKTSGLSQVQDAPSVGQYPRYFAFDPSGKWIIATNESSNTVVDFSVDEQTGKLTPLSSQFAPAPNCMVFLPAP